MTVAGVAVARRRRVGLTRFVHARDTAAQQRDRLGARTFPAQTRARSRVRVTGASGHPMTQRGHPDDVLEETGSSRQHQPLQRQERRTAAPARLNLAGAMIDRSRSPWPSPTECRLGSQAGVSRHWIGVSRLCSARKGQSVGRHGGRLLASSAWTSCGLSLRAVARLAGVQCPGRRESEPAWDHRCYLGQIDSHFSEEPHPSRTAAGAVVARTLGCERTLDSALWPIPSHWHQA
jgi:hypothetical protein